MRPISNTATRCGTQDGLPWLAEHPNLVILRTFSKAYGLAGARVGYAISHPEVADVLNRLRPAFNVNSLAQAGALAALADQAHMRSAVSQTLRELSAGRGRAAAHWDCGPRPRPPTFCCCGSAAPAAPVFERLLRRGLIVRPLAGYGLTDCLRISIGLPQHNDRLLAALPQVLAAGAAQPYEQRHCRAPLPAYVRPRSVQGELRVPGDKSISHRALMLGGIAEGQTAISGFLASEDCLATLAALRALGVCIERPQRTEVRVHGVGRDGLAGARRPLDMGNAGTAIRLLMGLLAGQRFDSTLIGDASLMRRPMERVAHAAARHGCAHRHRRGRPPVRIHGGAALQGIDYALPMASAQVKSAVLLAALYAQGREQRHRAGADARSHRAHAARLWRAS